MTDKQKALLKWAKGVRNRMRRMVPDAPATRTLKPAGRVSADDPDIAGGFDEGGSG